MKNDTALFLKAQIAVAIIGLVGSLGGAWISSGARFDREIASRSNEIQELRRTLLESQERLEEQQAKIDKIDGEIEYAKQKATELAIKVSDIVWQRLKTSWPFGGSSAEREQ